MVLLWIFFIEVCRVLIFVKEYLMNFFCYFLFKVVVVLFVGFLLLVFFGLLMIVLGSVGDVFELIFYVDVECLF